MSSGFGKIIWKKPFLVIVVSVICAVVSGCATAEFTAYREVFQPKPSDAKVDVYHTVLPKLEYVEIGMISCSDTDDNWNIKQVVKKAREIGADAIIILGRVGTYGAGIPVGNTMVYGADEGYGIRSVAIRYKCLISKHPCLAA
jgi:hypothetical protein